MPQLTDERLLEQLQIVTVSARRLDTGPSLRKVVYDEFDQRAVQAYRGRRLSRVLAEHYGFTDEELDFIINYDIKYRMGRGRVK